MLTVCDECELEASDDSAHSQYLHLLTVAVAMETLQRYTGCPTGVHSIHACRYVVTDFPEEL